MNSVLKKHYTERNDWHKANIPLVASYFNNQCQKCNRLTIPQKGAIHHLQYTGFDYKKTVDELLKNKAITWICKKCHEFEHIAYKSSEVNYKTKHSGYCSVCNKFAWFAWYNFGFGRLAGIGPSQFPLCKKCTNLLICENVLIKEQIDGKKFVNFQSNGLRTEKGQLIYDKIKIKLKDDEWGDRKLKENWQNSGHGGQINLFSSD